MDNNVDKGDKLFTGRCMCGDVSIEVRTSKNDVSACHCDSCRRWSGGPLLAIDCGKDVTIHGEENITVFSSSDWAERGFCQRCGTHLFFRLKQEQMYYIPSGVFDDESDLVFAQQIYVDEKPSYYDFANKTHNMTGAEVVAAFENS